MKNNKPACVLLSPSQYENLMEMVSDYLLYTEAENRMSACDDSETISHEELIKTLGLSEEDLAGIDVE